MKNNKSKRVYMNTAASACLFHEKASIQLDENRPKIFQSNALVLVPLKSNGVMAPTQHEPFPQITI